MMLKNLEMRKRENNEAQKKGRRDFFKMQKNLNKN